jgi:1,4-alpha-glucan branching enzyme
MESAGPRLDAIAAARNSDPFAVLGPHQTAAGWVIRVFAPEAISVRALSRDGALMAELPRRKGDFFEALIPSAKERPAYCVEVATAHGTYSYIDPYAFGPALGPLDDYLVREGTHRQLYRRLGAQLIRHEGVDGVLFAVWAPNATRVSVVGEFNRWDGRRSQMRRRFDSGLWEIFAPPIDGRSDLQVRALRAERRAVAAESGSVRSRSRAQAINRFGRRRQRRLHLDRRRIHG